MVGLERIINARLIYVCEEYIDFICTRYIGQTEAFGRRFARIEKADFMIINENTTEADVKSGFENGIMSILNHAIKEDIRLNLIIEKRDVEIEHANPDDKSPKKTQKIDFLIKVEMNTE